MNHWTSIFPQTKPIIGMVHVQALPGTPNHKSALDKITAQAVEEAKFYQKCGLNAIILENMHDTPYLNSCPGPEITAAMTAISCAVRLAVTLPVGIQILAAANKEALAVALAAGLQFIRAEGFVFGHIADEGYIDSCAGPLLRYRKAIEAEHIAVFTDIKKKHSAHNVTSDVSLGETAAAAEFFLSDGLVVTGKATGREILADDLIAARNHSNLPVLTGSGITADNIEQYWPMADGFIIGSYFKEDGLWSNPLSESRIRKLMEKIS